MVSLLMIMSQEFGYSVMHRFLSEEDHAFESFLNKEKVDGDQSALGPDLDRREVDGCQDIPVGLEEALPCRLSHSIR